MENCSISILGCGWLGVPLARHLILSGHKVKGSTTHRDKIDQFKQAKIVPFIIEVDTDVHGERIADFFQSDILILTLPFRRNLSDPEYYRQQIDAVIRYVKQSPIRYILFTSSTSVYPARIPLAVETDTIVPDNPRSQTLHAVEMSLLNQKNFQSTIVRFAGLYGGQRRIGQVLAGRTGLRDGISPVNLIHRDDCVNIMGKIIQKSVWGEIMNACSDKHPSRKEIYTKAAEHYGLNPPVFDDTLPQSRFKVVSNVKLKKLLDYTFVHPDPLNFP